MGNKKIIASKINAVGAMRQFTTGNKAKGLYDQISDKALKKAYCSIDNDSITTYVQKKEWIPNLNEYLYPPYVECEYVM